jgi:hypothetical protein
MPLKGPQLAYYLKRRDPELYSRAREVKERYGLTWDAAIAIAKGEAPPPPPSKVEELLEELGEVKARLEELEGQAAFMRAAAERRLRTCRWVDEEGYCRAWLCRERVEGLEMRMHELEGLYALRVRSYPVLCATCPFYRFNERILGWSPRRVELGLLRSLIKAVSARTRGTRS